MRTRFATQVMLTDREATHRDEQAACHAPARAASKFMRARRGPHWCVLQPAASASPSGSSSV